jgi:hypothetical protein
MYICKNTSCALAISKAAFPVAMNCPVCQTPLEEKLDSIELSSEDLELINSLPYVIAYPLKQTLLEKHAWSKINLFKDTFLNYLKYLGLLSASEFFNSDLKDKKMVALFQQTLAEPSFGTWNQFIRECLKYLNENNHNYLCKELANYYETIESGKKRKLYSGEIEYIDGNGDVQLKKQEATAIGMLINFRNRYLGHGLTLDSDTSEKLWNEYFPIFKTLLKQLSFAKDYPMLKRDGNETHLLHSAEINTIESSTNTDANIWVQNKEGIALAIVPFFIVPGEVAISNTEKAKVLSYESYTGKTIKFFSPEGIEKQTSGKILEKLNLLLREKQKEIPFTPKAFTKDEFLKRIAEENKLLLDTLIAEKKIIPGVYQHREEVEIKLREWIGARASVFFIAAEAGSGKTNLLVEIQKQYTERELPSLLIRAGRMERHTLKEQIAYLLNIDVQKGLENYKAIAETQANPTLILIDGLNEANNAETIWQEIIELCKLFEPGSLKFVVTSRANTRIDLDRYYIDEVDSNLLYGEKNDEKGLAAFSFWLTALDMKEMKAAWENYATKDKSRFKPIFTFDDISTFDRALYNQINNPLILRLFLEIYNGKPLPKKGVKYLHVWQDWFNTFSQEEQSFLKLLADDVWEKGENELLLDDLLKNEIFKPYLTSGVINAPYNRLKNSGWISRYTKDLNSYLSFTVEGALLYLLGIKLEQRIPILTLNEIQFILKNDSKLQKSSIESFLCEEALKGNIDLLVEIIDTDQILNKICIPPLIIHFKNFGVESSLEKLFNNESKNDWITLKAILDELQKLNQYSLQTEILRSVINYIKYDSKESIHVGIYATHILEISNNIFKQIITKLKEVKKTFNNEVELLDDYGKSLYKNGEIDEALKTSNSCIEIRLSVNDFTDIKLVKSYINSSYLYMVFKEYDNAEEFAKKALNILSNNHPNDFVIKSAIYNQLGMIMAEKLNFEDSYNYHKESLEIKQKHFGNIHDSVAVSYFNLGALHTFKKEFEKSLAYHLEGYKIKCRVLGLNHESTYKSCLSIARVYKYIGDYNLSIEYYETCLLIAKTIYSQDSATIAGLYFDFGTIYFLNNNIEKSLEKRDLGIQIYISKYENTDPDLIGKKYYEIAEGLSKKDYSIEASPYFENAIKYLMKACELNKKGNFVFLIAKSQEALNIKKEAFSSYIESCIVRKDSVGLDHKVTKESISNTIRLAKELNKENELPNWIKEIN